ncbi:hypothetical protein EDC01DRAFT_79980 [Geopyxis carbonaria]|nr:hypothetical protein EDC01DRAFT_79980 [Geopyxis carbonaria]
MTSTDPLPVELINALLSFTSTFHTTASRFQSYFREDGLSFYRVCEIHNTLDILAASQSPITELWKLRGQDKDGPDSKQDAEDLLSVMLNAEFLLYYMYREHPLNLNPALSHWISICRGFDKFERETQKSEPKWGLRERVMKIRSIFVKGILSDHVQKIAETTPQEIAIRGHHYEIDIDRFREAVREQGIEGYDSLVSPIELDDETDNKAQPHQSRATAHNSTPAIQEHENITDIIYKATRDEIPAEFTNRFLVHIKNTPELLSSYPLDLLNIPTITGLWTSNPHLTRGIIFLILAHGGLLQRRELIRSLEFLPISLGCLEMITEFATNTKILNNDEIARLIHGLLENGIRSAEAMAVGWTGGLGEAYDPSGGATVASRQAQSRHVRLLCLFIQNLFRKNVVMLEDIYYQIQDMGVKFMFVKEARDLWRTHCAT